MVKTMIAIRDIDNLKVRRFIERMANYKVITTRKIYCDSITFSSKIHDGYRMERRLIRIFDPDTVISELEQYIEEWEPGSGGRQKLGDTPLLTIKEIESIRDSHTVDIDPDTGTYINKSLMPEKA